MRHPSGSPSTSPVEEQSIYSFSTTTSTSTFIGPGSLAGKAIQNIGKLTLKGVEQILISRRLSSIETYFPHQDLTQIAGLPEMYTDLLELSRIQMYSHSTRIRALQLIVGQIASRYYGHLIKALLASPKVEVSLLLSEILACLDPTRTSHLDGSPLEGTLLSAYRKSLSKWEDHYLGPAIDFLRDFASSGKETWSIAIGCGTLDLLLHLYLSDFDTPPAFNAKAGPLRKSSVFATCNSFLVEAFADEHAHLAIQSHALRGLWPLWSMHPFETTDVAQSSLRSQTWQRLEKRHIQWRISSIFDTFVIGWIKPRSARLVAHMRLYVNHMPFDNLVDLLEFSGSSMLDEDTCFRALRSLHRLLTRCLDTTQISAKISMYIEQTGRDHAREIFIRIVRRLMLLSRRAQESDTFFAFCPQNCQPHSCPLDPDASVHFIHCLLTTSKSNETLRRWLVEGDIARLLDSTETRSLSYGTRTRPRLGDIRDSGNSRYIMGGPGGPTYRALVLSLAWRMFNSPTEDARARNSANEADLRFPLKNHHDDWADNWMYDDVFQYMWQTHRNRVYSWIES